MFQSDTQIIASTSTQFKHIKAYHLQR